MRKLPNTISEKEFLEIFKAEKERKYKVAYALGFYQCMRVSEIAGLKQEVSKCCRAKIKKARKPVKRSCSKCNKSLELKDISRGGKWQIPPLQQDQVDKDRGFIKIISGKGGKDDTIPIMPPVFQILRWGTKYLPVKATDRTLRRRIKALGEEILGKDIYFHTLRHSGASFWLNDKKVDIRHIQMLLRHSRLDTTQIYTHTSPNKLKEIFDEAY